MMPIPVTERDFEFFVIAEDDDGNERHIPIMTGIMNMSFPTTERNASILQSSIKMELHFVRYPRWRQKIRAIKMIKKYRRFRICKKLCQGTKRILRGIGK